MLQLLKNRLMQQNQAQTITDIKIDAIVSTFLQTFAVKTGTKYRD